MASGGSGASRAGRAGRRRSIVVGCAGRIVQFSETEDGRYLVALEGVARFRLGPELEGRRGYRRAEADWSAFPHDRDPGGGQEGGGEEEGEEASDRTHFCRALQGYLESQNLLGEWEGL